MISVVIPNMRLVGANVREHWRKRHQRSTIQRGAARMIVRASVDKVIILPAVVTIVRCGPGALDDDNAVYAAKFVRDGVADALGIDDRDSRVTWVVRQERAKTWGVRIEITKREEQVA